jgi:predicted ATPase
MRQALDIIQQPVTIFTKATVLCRAALLHLLRGEMQQVSQLTGQANAITSETRYPYFRASGLIIDGYASLVAQSDMEGITAIRQGLAMHERAGAYMDRPFYLALLADALRLTGQYAQALQTLQPAIEQVQQGRTFFYEAELYRLQGQILQEHDPGASAAAEASYRQALNTAERQGSPSLQLRAAVSLVQLWMDQGQENEARAADAKKLLDEILATFSEGFTTADLTQAQALLQPAA